MKPYYVGTAPFCNSNKEACEETPGYKATGESRCGDVNIILICRERAAGLERSINVNLTQRNGKKVHYITNCN